MKPVKITSLTEAAQAYTQMTHPSKIDVIDYVHMLVLRQIDEVRQPIIQQLREDTWERN